ncbi:MAG: inorganic diphosphatase [Saccharospirillaceae bacterium]|nr:inorganic diphosphatase [Pseudomonadales bacterium]NRB80627.1 inorganic diphosphatase [Saccharospirillaceae bacterium]
MINSKILIFLTASVLAFTAYADEFHSDSVTVVDDYTIKGSVNFFSGIETGDADGNINVVIEIPKGTKGKWEVNSDDGTIIWEFKNGKPRTVEYMNGYPANYGSVPRTAMPAEFGGDGESLDVVVVGDQIARGEIVQVKVIGILNLREGEDEFDGKIIAVRIGSAQESVSSFEELNAKFNNEGDTIASWFSSYKGPGEIVIEGIGSPEEAMEIVNASASAFSD